MKSRLLLGTLTAAVLLAGTACTAPGTEVSAGAPAPGLTVPDQAALNACAKPTPVGAGGADGEPIPIAAAIEFPNRWVKVTSDAYAPRSDQPVDASNYATPDLIKVKGFPFKDLKGQAAGDAGRTFYMSRSTYDRGQSELQRGATVIVPMHDDGVDGTTTVPFLLTLRSSKELRFIEPCSMAQHQPELESFFASDATVKATGQDPAGVVAQQLTDDKARADLVSRLRAAARASAPAPPTTRPGWAARDPFDRNMDDADVPPSVINQVKRGFVTFELPAAWLTSDSLVCTRSSLAWNPCVKLNSDAAKKGRVNLNTYALPGEAVQVYLLGGPTADDARKPLGKLGSFSIETKSEVTMKVRPESQQLTPGQIKTAASQNQPVMAEG